MMRLTIRLDLPVPSSPHTQIRTVAITRRSTAKLSTQSR